MPDKSSQTNESIGQDIRGIHAKGVSSGGSGGVNVDGKPDLRRPFKTDLSGSNTDWVDRSDMVKAFMGVIGTRDDLAKSLEALRILDVVQIALDVIVDDGFIGSAENSQPFFQIVYSEKKKDLSGNKKGPDDDEDEDDDESSSATETLHELEMIPAESNPGQEHDVGDGIGDETTDEDPEEDKDTTEKPQDNPSTVDDLETPSDETKESASERKINKKIRSFIEDVGLLSFVKDILDDLLLLGDYAFRIRSEKDKGIVELIDDVEQQNVVPIYDSTTLDFFLEKKGAKFIKREPDEMAHFCLGSKKIRIQLADRKTAEKRRIPQYVRVGRSIFYPVIRKLKRLQVAEMASVVKSLKKIMMPTLISLGVPSNAAVEDVREAINKYEQSLNSFLRTIKDPSSFSFAEMFEMVGRIKCVPNFSDGKGQIAPVDTSIASDSTASQEEDQLRAECALGIGIPVYYVQVSAGGANSADKITTLKSYSRYARKLVSTQDSVEEGLKDLVILHLQGLGVTVKKDQLDVKFKTIVNLDLLDTIEFTVASTQTLRDLYETLNEIATSDSLKVQINNKKFLALSDQLLAPLGIPGLLEEISPMQNMGAPPPGTVGADGLVAASPTGNNPGTLEPVATGPVPSPSPEEGQALPPPGGATATATPS